MPSSLGNTQLLVGRATGYSSLNTADISGNLLVTNDATLNTRLFVSGDASLNGRLYVSGNVGIGTTNPTYTLDISAASATAPLRVQIGGTNALVVNSSGNFGIGTSPVTNSMFSLGSQSITTNFPLYLTSIGSSADAYNPAATSGSSRGTYNVPGMAVQGATYPNSTNQAFLFDLNCYNSTNGACGVYFGGISTTGGNNSAGQFVIGRRTGVTAWTESLRINDAGNVGIGTTNPSHQLSVGGSTGMAIYSNISGTTQTFNSTGGNAGTYIGWNMLNGGAETDIVNFNSGSYSGGFAFYNTTGTTFSSSSPLLMRITAAGNVGIGTTNPQTILSTGTTVSNIKLALYDDGATSTNLYGIGAANNAITFSAGQSVSANPQMVLKSSGNVGIGQTNPQYPLDVTGSVNSTGQYNYIGHNSGPPAGAISAYLGTTDPDGWIICDGVQRTNGADGRYNRLITAGIGSGTANSTYTPPNLKGQFLYGSSTTSSVNGTGGASSVTLTTANLPAHNHTATDSGHTHANTLTDPGHVHQQNSSDDGGRNDGTTAQSNNNYTQTGFNTNSATTGITITNASSTANITIGNTGSGTSFSILPTYTTVNYIIKY